MGTMKAVVIREPGGPDVLKLEDQPIPRPKAGWVLIRVRAFGLNRSELFTRQGHSPNVAFPRILGIEAVGTVESDPSGTFDPGQKVATAMGGMGRSFDGGYAEYTLVPLGQVVTLRSSLDWRTLGALPEMIQTAWGSLTIALRAARDESILIRGGTSSVGLAAATLAKRQGLTVVATTRRAERHTRLIENGADHAVVDTGSIAGEVKKLIPGGVDRVLELVGTTTLLDSLQSAKPGGSVCMTGMVGGTWELDNFSPMGSIPTAVNLTTYSGGVGEFAKSPLQEFIDLLEAGEAKAPVGPVFDMDDIVDAHRTMENNMANGKIVVLT